MANTKSPKAALEKLQSKEAKLLKEKEQIENKLKTLKSNQSKEKRKLRTRRLVLIGAAVENKINQSPEGVFAKEIHSILDNYIEKSGEREFLGLPPLPEKKLNEAKLKNDFNS